MALGHLIADHKFGNGPPEANIGVGVIASHAPFGSVYISTTIIPKALLYLFRPL